MNDRFIGLKIGSIFTIVSLLLTLTIVIPVFSIVPGSFIELAAEALLNNNSYANVGYLTTILLGVIFVLSLIMSFIYIRRQVNKNDKLSRLEIVVIMAIFWLIVHPLAFYIYAGIGWGFKPDGQSILAAIKTFPVSSLWFFVMGAMTDSVKNRY